MSLTEKDRKVRSEYGKPGSEGGAANLSAPEFAHRIAAALKEEFGTSSGGVKSVVRMTGANERAVKNWFAAKNGPSGVNLVVLLGRSDRIFETVLALTPRQKVVGLLRLSICIEHVESALKLLTASMSDADHQAASSDA